MIIDIIMEILTEDFCAFLVALTALMIGNLISGVAKSIKSGTFDKKVMFRGILNYVLWLVAVSFIVAGINVYGRDFTVTINNESITLEQAIEYAKKAVYLYWAAKGIQNFIEYGNIKSEVTPDMPEIFDDSVEEDQIDKLVG